MRKKRRKIYRVKRKKSIFKSWYSWSFVLFFIFVFAVLYFLVFFDKFQVKQLIISGNVKVLGNELENATFQKINRSILFFNSKSIFLISKKELKSKILKNYPQIEQLNVKKNLPDKLILEIKERSAVAVFCLPAQTGETCFLIDRNGVIFEPYNNFSEEKMIIRLTESSPLKEGLGTEVIKVNFIDSALKIQKNLKENFQINVKESIFISPVRLNVKTADGWEIYFSLESDIDLQITKLNLLLKQEIPPENWKDLEYIDLRFSKVFYKFR